jgi:hypothetical protein
VAIKRQKNILNPLLPMNNKKLINIFIICKYTYKMSEKCYYCGEYSFYKCAFCDKMLCDDTACSRNNQTEGFPVSGCPCYINFNELICKDCIRANGTPGIILHTENGDHYVSTEVISDEFYGICIISALLIGFIIGYSYK